jgi:predicted O-linked N-acetylglucosamine transferase (SPINDLY family)
MSRDSETSVSPAIQLARRHQRAGRWTEAEQVCREILERDNDDPEALHLLGTLAGQQGRLEQAVDWISRAIALRPDVAEYHNNLGLSLRALGRGEEAILACRRAIALKPDFAKAYLSLGVLLAEKGAIVEAIDVFQQATRRAPGDPEAWFNLGVASGSAGKVAESIAAYQRAVRIRPEFLPALHGLREAFQSSGQFEAARDVAAQAAHHASINAAMDLTGQGRLKANIPASLDRFEVFMPLAAALREAGRLDAAIVVCRQAVTLKPDDPRGWNNLGVMLGEQGDADEAIAAFREALRLRPAYADAFNNLGLALRGRGLLDEATDALRQAVLHRPDCAEFYNSLASVLKDTGRMPEAVAAYTKAVELNPTDPAIDSNRVYTLLFTSGYDAAALLREHRKWDERHGRPLADRIKPRLNDRPADRPADRRLRVGYVSPHFRAHVVAQWVLPLLEHHDHASFEIFAYSDARPHTAMTETIHAACDQWRDTAALSHESLADLIRADGIDLLIDLTLHMGENRLPVFARKPAPVQVTFLAYPFTSGLSAMDYRLTDSHLDPPEQGDAGYTERSIHLPETWCCYRPMPAAADLPPGPPPSLASGSITFGCLNNLCKVTPEALSLWCEILTASPRYRLHLTSPPGSTRQRLADFLRARGIDEHRVSFTGPLPLRDYLRQYHHIDIALDPMPYGGGTTTCDALWMGVPVISLFGQTPMSRSGLTLLSNIGLPHLAADSPRNYINAAIHLAEDPAALRQLRAELRGRMLQSPLMDAPRYAKNVEVAYRRMWAMKLKGEDGGP